MTTMREVARFVADLRFHDLPLPVVERAKHMVQNAWASQLAGSTLPWSRAIFRAVREQGGTPESTVVTYGLRTSAANAGFLNSTFQNGLEMDDNHALAAIKGGSVTVPTATAVGERQLSSGTDLLTAIVAGYEVMIRAALMIRPSATRRATHPTGTSGAIGAGVVAGKLLGFDEERLLHTLGGSAVCMGGFSESPPGGRGHLKRIFGAMAVANGIRAALLAEAGLTGPETTLDVGYGFCRAFDVDEEQSAMLTRGLGTQWELLNVHIKPYAQDGYIQPMSEALELIRQARGFALDEIESIWVGTNHRAANEIVGLIREPVNLGDAQFSANFSVALYLVRGGAGFHDYTEDALHDPRIRELARRVVVEVDDEIDREYRRTRPRGAKVTIRLTSGDELHAHVPNLRDMTPEELDDKFRELAAVVLEDSPSTMLLDMCHHLDEIRDVSTIMPLLIGRN